MNGVKGEEEEEEPAEAMVHLQIGHERGQASKFHFWVPFQELRLFFWEEK
jgi:hypothetical protein